MTKHLVTGGAGFVGSRLVEMLLDSGQEVVAVDNFVGSMNGGKNIEHLLANPNFKLYQQDYVEWIENNELDGFDTIFHQAASKNTVSLTYPERDLRVNALGTQRLALKAASAKVRKFVHASTGSVYGDLVSKQDENHPLAPNSLYGVSKLAGEGYVRTIGNMNGLDYTILRYFHVIGARQDDSPTGGVVPIFLRMAKEGKDLTVFGSGNQVRSFTWVDDVVRANIYVSQSPKAKQETYNCASGIAVTINELAEYVLELTGAPVSIKHEPAKPGDVFEFNVSNEKISAIGVDFERDWKSVVRKVWKHANK